MDPPAVPAFWNAANILTLSRLALAPFVFGLIAYGFHVAAAVVFLLAAVTDWLDGYVARRLKIVSAMGRQLDPLVDKVIVVGCYVYLLAQGTRAGLAPWMVTVIVARELIVQALRSLLEGQGEAFGAKLTGKLKTVTQFLAIVAILLVLAWQPPRAWVVLRDALIWASVLLTVLSGAHYLVVAWPLLAGERPAGPAQPHRDRP
jgi:CDP-diacylglycerol--glycerol-3-phosphate 3-phosphatidyltransferase